MTASSSPAADPVVDTTSTPDADRSGEQAERTAGPSARDRRAGRAERTAWRGEFDALVMREYPTLVAECAMLIDDRGRAERLVRRAMAGLWRDWARVREHENPAELVRDRVHERTAAQPATPLGRWWRRRPSAAGRAGADTLVALRAIPRVQRRAVVLHHGTGRSLERIAAVEGTSGHAIRMRLAHGAHAMAHHHPATPTIPITTAWSDLERLGPEEADGR